MTKLNFSRLIFGAWRLADSPQEANTDAIGRKILMALESGLTTFDHADIYGNYECENMFGQATSKFDIPRHKMQIITKCGIKLLSDKKPQHSIKSYDTTRAHITQSVENSLRHLRTDYVDLLLLHRPDPLMNPEEVNATFHDLLSQGKVKAFGVSNFSTSQVRMLQSKLTLPLVANQIEFSLLNTAPLQTGQLDQCLEMNLMPMAWSPLGGGRLMTQNDERSSRLRETCTMLARKYEVEQPETIAYAWLLKHPAGVVPVLGTGKAERLRAATAALNLQLDHDDWFALLKAAVGTDVP